jgi:hypothetical protein
VICISYKTVLNLLIIYCLNYLRLSGQKFHKPSALNNLFLTVMEVGKSRVKFLANLFPRKGSHPGLPFCYVLTWPFLSAQCALTRQLSLFLQVHKSYQIKTPLIGIHLTLDVPQSPISKILARYLTYEFWRNAIESIVKRIINFS